MLTNTVDLSFKTNLEQIFVDSLGFFNIGFLILIIEQQNDIRRTP